MKKFFPRHARLHAPIFFALALVSLLHAQSFAAPAAQRREHLTELEVEKVRDTQDLDRRISLFVKFVERRLGALASAPAAAPQTPTAKETAKEAKEASKELEELGELPKGTRAQLLGDVARILDEAINNVDDVATRSPSSPLLPKAVRKLSEGAARFLPRLTPLRESATGEGEREALEQAIDSLQQIMDAAKKLPADETPEKKGDRKNN